VRYNRHLDSVGVGVCDTQEFYLHPSAVDRSVDTEDCSSVEGVGLGYREEKTQSDKRYQELNYILQAWSRIVCTDM
jgi:hypothetical protein